MDTQGVEVSIATGSLPDVKDYFRREDINITDTVFRIRTKFMIIAWMECLDDRCFFTTMGNL